MGMKITYKVQFQENFETKDKIQIVYVSKTTRKSKLVKNLLKDLEKVGFTNVVNLKIWK